MSHGLEGFVTNLTGGLARLWCDRCKEERIHKGHTCVCGATHKAYPVRSVYTRSISVTPRKRGAMGKAYPLVLQGSRPPKVVAK